MKRPLSMAVGLVAQLFSGVALFAQPLADRVPADAIAYFGWQGTENVSGYAGSHFEAIIKESNIPVVFKQVLPQAIVRIAKEDRKAGEAFQLAYDLLAPIAKYPTAFFFEGVKFDGDRPMPQLGLVCRAGADAPRIQEKLLAVLAKAGKPEVPVKVVVSGQDVAILVGYGPDEMALAGDVGGRADALGADAGFKAALAKVKADPVVAFHLDVEALFKLIDGAVEKEADENERAMYNKVVDAVGVRSVRRIIASSGFDGKDWMEQVYVEAPMPRKGILNMLDAPALSDDLVKTIPATAEAFVGGTLDIGKLLTEIRAIVGEVDPQAQKMFDQGIGGATMAVGRNFQTEVLDPLGAHWVAYSAPEVAGGGLPGMVIINKPDDATKAKSGLLAVSIFASNTAASLLAQKDSPVTITGRQVKYGDLAINYLATPLVTPCWSVAGDYLIAGFYPQSIIGASRQIAAGKGSIVDSSEYKALRARLGVDKIQGITYANLPASAAGSYGLLMVGSRLVGVADLFGVATPPIVIPPYHVFAEHLSVAGSVSWVEDDGIHSKRVVPFPGAELLQGGGAAIAPVIGMAALQTSILLPSLNRARETANRVKCANNLRQIMLGARLYANENGGKFPDSLGDILKTQDIEASVFVCPSDSDSERHTEALNNPDRAAAADWINANSHYVWIGAGKTDQGGAETPMLYERPANHDFDGINIGFADCHIEFQTGANAQQIIPGLEFPARRR